MSDCKKVTNADKWSISLLSACIFAVMSMSLVHSLLNSLAQPLGFRVLGANGGLTLAGLFVVSFVFMLIVRALMY